MKRRSALESSVALAAAAVLVGAGATPRAAHAAGRPDTHPWHLSVSGGVIDFEGDEAVDDGAIVALRVGRDCSEEWSIEGGLECTPKLDEQWRHDWRSGQRVSRLEEAAGVHDTYSLRLTLGGLRHLTRWEKFDPFFAVGAGAVWYADDFNGSVEGFGDAGVGCFYHLTDEWALRADFRAILAVNDTEANSAYTIGLSWTPGAHVPPPRPPAVRTAGVPIETRGGVAGGPAVAEGGASQTNNPDRRLFFELCLAFDPGDWKIKAEYFSEIGVIGKILKDDAKATASIEGHVDRKTEPSERKAMKLSERRAEAVRAYLMANWNISRERLTSAGYGFSRPKGPSAPQKGNVENERIEIYITPSAPKAP